MMIHAIFSLTCCIICFFYLISKEDAVLVVVFSMVNPRIADEMDASMAGDIFKSECFEVELTVMKICYCECPRKPHLLAPLEADIILRRPCCQRGDCFDPVF